jgi:glycine cleavage system aminomethyltransferase T
LIEEAIDVPAARCSTRPGTKVAVEIVGEWVDGEVVQEPLWDPEGSRAR